jgi:hypothetical protein
MFVSDNVVVVDAYMYLIYTHTNTHTHTCVYACVVCVYIDIYNHIRANTHICMQHTYIYPSVHAASQATQLCMHV